MRGRVHILLLLALLAVSCGGPRKIPRDDMVDIVVDMLIQDQQLKQDPKLRVQNDSTLVYEGIFQAYGYDTDDFRYSLYYYLEDPSRMEKIMGDAAGILSKMAQATAREIDLEKWRQKMMALYAMQPDTSYPRPSVRPVDTLPVRFDHDSVWIHRQVDSLTLLPTDSLIFRRDSL